MAPTRWNVICCALLVAYIGGPSVTSATALPFEINGTASPGETPDVTLQSAQEGNNPLPTALDLFEIKDIEHEVSFLLNKGCDVKVSLYHGCQFSLNPFPIGCLSISALLSRLFPDSFRALESQYVPFPNKVYIDSLGLDRCQHIFYSTFSVQASFTAIPGLLTMESVMGELEISNITLTPKISRIGYAGLWNLEEEPLDFFVEYEVGRIHASGGHKNPQASFPIGKLISGATKNFGEIEGNLAEITKTLHLESLTVRNVQAEAVLSKDEGSSLRFAVNLVDGPLSGGKLEVMLTKIVGSSFTVHFFGSFGETSLAGVVDTLTGLELRNTPLLGKVTVPGIKFLFSTKTVDKILLDIADEDFLELSPTIKGLRFVTEIPKSPGSMDTWRLYANISKTVEFSFTKEKRPIAKEFLKPVFSFLQSVILPSGIPMDKFLASSMDHLSYDRDKKMFQVCVTQEGTLELINGYITIQDTSLLLALPIGKDEESTQERNLGVKLSTTWILGDTDVQLNFEKSSDTNVYAAEAKANHLQLPTLLPSQFSSFSQLLDMRLNNPHVKMVFGDEVLLRVTGQPTFGNLPNLKAELFLDTAKPSFGFGMIMKDSALTKVVSFITMGNIDLSSMPGARLFHNTSLAVTVERFIEKTDIIFETEEISKIDVVNGIQLAGEFNAPDDCLNDILCEILKRPLRALTLQIRTILDQGSIKTTVKLPIEIPLLAGTTMRDLMLEVSLSQTEQSVSVGGSIILPSPELTFTGILSFSKNSLNIFELGLDMYMKGLWENAFNLPFLAVGDLMFGVSIPPPPTLISRLALGGRVILGLRNNPQAIPIEAEAYIGVDLGSPENNYLYAKITSFTFGSLLRAFGKYLPIPQPVLDTGFPQGLALSFALIEQNIEQLDMVIPAGFSLRGTIQILTLSAFADIRVSQEGFYTHLVVNPFRLGNILDIGGRSSSQGPRLLIDTSWGSSNQRCLLEVEGTVRVLGISTLLNVSISNEGLYFKVQGSAFDLFEAVVEVHADTTLTGSGFEVSGYFRNDLIERLREGALAGLQKLREIADAAIDGAEAGIESAQRKLSDARGEVTKLQNKLNDAKRHFDNVNGDLERKKRDFDGKKRDFENKQRQLTDKQKALDREKRKVDDAVRALENKKRHGCPSACRRRRAIGGPEHIFLDAKRARQFIKPTSLRRSRRWGWNPFEKAREVAERAAEVVKERAREAWCIGKWIARQACLAVIEGLKWVVDKAKIVFDAAKLALEVAKKALDVAKIAMDIAKGALSVAQGIVNLAKGALDAANLLLEGAKFILKSAEKTLDIAMVALEGVRALHRFGIAIAEKAISFGLGGLIDIKEISFRTKLSVANGGEFEGSMKAAILRKDIQFAFYLKLRSVSSMIESLLTTISKNLGARRKRSIEEHVFPTLTQLKMGENVTEQDEHVRRVMTDPFSNCSVFDDVFDITTLVVSDTEGLTITVKKLTVLQQTFKPANGSNVTLDDIDEVTSMARDALSYGLDSVRDLVVTETEMDEAQVLHLLETIETTSADECLKGTAHRVQKVLNHPAVDGDIEDLHVTLTWLHDMSRSCLAHHHCTHRYLWRRRHRAV